MKGKMKVLVTGSNGFVGSNIVEALLERGHQVVCQVRKTSSLKWLKGLNVEYSYGDVLEKDSVTRMIRGVDAIIHNAAILRAIRHETYYLVNQMSVRNICDAVLTHNPGLRKIILMSSQAAMGPCDDLRPKKVGESENPISDYGRSKLAAEKELKALDGKLPYTILRPSSVYGPRDKDLFIFFRLINMGLRPTPFKKRYIQLLFVKDLARAAVLARERPQTDNKTYFLSEPRPYSWEEVGRTIADAVSRKTHILPLPDFIFRLAAFFSEIGASLQDSPAVLNRQKIDEMHQCYWVGDAAEAEKDFQMDFTKLKIGARITYDWYKQNKWL